MTCPRHLEVQARFDGELDEAAILEIDAHLETCAQCRLWLADLATARERFREVFQGVDAPAELLTRARQGLEQAAVAPEVRAPVPVSPMRQRLRPRWRLRPHLRRHSFWFGALSGAGGLATAAALVLLWWIPASSGTLQDTLVANHLQSLEPDRLVEVQSSDHHTVKPWFAGRTEVSPAVQDFAQQGFTLVGGRADELQGRRPAILVYRHGAHVINVYGWREDSPHFYRNGTRAGFHLLFWRADDIRYCAVSDAGWSELRRLQALIDEAQRDDRRGETSTSGM